MKTFLPIKTVNVANKTREHYMQRHHRVAREKYLTTVLLCNAFGAKPPDLPLRVTLTRSSPSKLIDSDSAIIAMKPCRDAIARWLGVDDLDSPLLVWDYSVPKVVGPMGVHVTLTRI